MMKAGSKQTANSLFVYVENEVGNEKSALAAVLCTAALRLLPPPLVKPRGAAPAINFSAPFSFANENFGTFAASSLF